jgi:hypothetical protein
VILWNSSACAGITEEWKWNTPVWSCEVRRAIDFAQGAQVDEAALQALMRSAIALNKSAGSKR